jgi:BON domain-containing protein
MTRRSRILAAAVLGLCAGYPATGRAADLPPATSLPPVPAALAVAEPARPDVAAAISDALRQAGQAGLLRYYNVEVAVKDGTAELGGTVANAQQREHVLMLARGVAGVSRVVDKMTLLAPGAIAQVQATAPAAAPAQAAPPPIREALVPAAPPAGIIPEPVPTFAAPMPSPYDLNPPRMPPYAWPTYAPYNNFSRVGYPLAYPYQSWPYIGPFYPFPKIPPGWRSVKLEWEDGHWWFSKVATKCDWWRLRFW